MFHSALVSAPKEGERLPSKWAAPPVGAGDNAVFSEGCSSAPDASKLMSISREGKRRVVIE